MTTTDKWVKSNHLSVKRLFMKKGTVKNMDDRSTLLHNSCLYAETNSGYPTIIDHPDFKYLCEIIQGIRNQDYKDERTGEARRNTMEITNYLNSMQNILRRMFGIDLEITIVNNLMSNPKEFFGCNVYPFEDQAVQVARKIIDPENYLPGKNVKDIWLSIKEWHMDLDEKIFFDTTFIMNPAEIATLIFFNIENVVYNLRIPERCNFIINSKMNAKSILVTKLARSSICKRLFSLPIIQSCRYKNYPYMVNKLMDGSCLHEGYLNQYYMNMVRKIVAYTTNEFVDESDKRLDEEICQIAEWLFTCVDNMRYNTTLIVETVKNLLIMEKSTHVATILSNILMDIGEYNRSQIVDKENPLRSVREEFSYNNTAIEFRQKQYKAEARKRIDREFGQIIREGLLNLLDNIGNMKKISQREIDMIRVMGQKCEDADDKLYVLDELHSKLEIVEGSLALLDSKDPDKIKKVKLSRSILLDQKKQLDAIREEIIKREIKEPEYSVFARYPKGYEG